MRTSLIHMIAGFGLLSLTLSFGRLTSSGGGADATPLIELHDQGHHPGTETIDFRSGVARALPSIVTIYTGSMRQVNHEGNSNRIPEKFGPGQQNPSTAGVGSGVIVSSDGFIVTNHHVVFGMGTITVELSDQRRFSATVIGSDQASDLALIRIDVNGLVPAEFALSDQLRPGEAVAAIGNPFGVGISVSAGVISALGRHGIDLTEDDYYIQTDAALNPGNSGGALINRFGQVVGINTAIYSRTGSHAGIGFAVPSVTVSALCQQILDYGEVQRGVLGVTLDPRPDTEPGVRLEAVSEDSPAQRAGLMPGDRILAINGLPINGAASLRNRVRLMRNGNQITLSIRRDGKTMDKTLALGTAELENKPMADRFQNRDKQDRGWRSDRIMPN